MRRSSLELRFFSILKVFLLFELDFAEIFLDGFIGPIELFGWGVLAKIRLPVIVALADDGLDDFDDFDDFLVVGDFEERDCDGFDRKMGPILDGRLELELGDRLEFELLGVKGEGRLLDDFPRGDLLLNDGLAEDLGDFDEENDLGERDGRELL